MCWMQLMRVQRIFRNSSIQYDHFKIISFQFHYWIADLGTTDSDSYQKMETFKAYDRDGVDINHTKETIQSYVNCKFRRLQPGKHYVQTIRPQYLQTKYTGSVAGGLDMMRSARFDNPWWNTGNCNTVDEIDKFPTCNNSYSIALCNPDSANTKIVRCYYTCYLKYSGYTRVTIT